MLALLKVDDGQDTGDRLAQVVAVRGEERDQLPCLFQRNRRIVVSPSSPVQHALDGYTIGADIGVGVGEADVEGHRMVFVSSLDIHLV